MKNILALLFLIVVLFGGSCKKQDLSLSPLKYSWGSAKAEVNDTQWQANACRAGISPKKSDTIFLELGRADNIQFHELLRFHFLPIQLGIYYLPDMQLNLSNTKTKTVGMNFFIKGDNDLDCAAYENLHDADSLQNWVEITEYNEKTKEIKGKFSCNMIINPKGSNAGPKCKPTDPDTIRIRNGMFHTKIMN